MLCVLCWENSTTPTVAIIMGTAIEHPVPDRVNPVWPERQSGNSGRQRVNDGCVAFTSEAMRRSAREDHRGWLDADEARTCSSMSTDHKETRRCDDDVTDRRPRDQARSRGSKRTALMTKIINLKMWVDGMNSIIHCGAWKHFKIFSITSTILNRFR